MMEYIERELVEKMIEDAQIISDGENCGYCTDDISISSIPAADVAPVVHGRWENKKGSPVSCYWTKDMKHLMVQEEAYCSVCGEYLNASAEYTVEGTFCPHCGAKMDGGQHETD